MSVIRKITEKISPKQMFAALLAVEMILVAAAVFLCLRPEREYSFTGEELETVYGIYLENFLEEYGDGYYLDNALYPDGKEDLEDVTIETPKTDLPRGTYEIIINYAANENLNTYTCRAKYNTYQIIYGKQYVGLDPEKNSVAVWMYSPLKMVDYQMSVRYGGSGYLLVNSIVIRETKEWKCVSLFIIISVSLLLDGWLLWKKKRKRTPDASAKTIFFLSVLLVLLSSAPALSFFLNGVGDLDFHLARIEALTHALKAGQFPVRLPGYWCSGYGYASSVFYGELFLYFPAALRIIGFSPQSAYKMYMLCVNLFTCLLTYYCLKRICKERLSAFMGTAVYMLAPQRLITLHLFGAVGMYTAMVFLPVVAYGLYLIYMQAEAGPAGKKNGWLWLFLGFSGLVQCHVINTFIVFLFALLVCVIKIRTTLQRDVLLQFVKAVACTVLVNLWFLLPFMDFMRFDYKMSALSTHSRGRFGANGTFISQLISFFPHAEGCSISAGMEAGIDTPGVEMSYTLGGGIMLAVVLYIVYGFYRRQEDSRLRKIEKMALGICLLSLCMTTIWFPWDFLQQRSDLIAWVTGSIQFPWRFLNIASAAGAFVAAFLIYELRRYAKKEFLYGAILSVGLLSLISADYFLQDYEKRSEARYITSDEVESWAIEVAEYLPAGTDDTTFARDALQQRGEIEVLAYERGEGTVALTCGNRGQDAAYIDVPILYYMGYTARDTGTGERLEVVPADNKRVRVILPAGYEGSFVVKFESPWYWRVSEVISLTAVIVLAVALIRVSYGAQTLIGPWRMRVKKEER